MKPDYEQLKLANASQSLQLLSVLLDGVNLTIVASTAYVHIFQLMHLSPYFLKLPGQHFYSAEQFKLSQRWLIKMDELTIS